MIEIIVQLGQAYFNQPFFNIGVAHEGLFGPDGAHLSVYLGNWNMQPIVAHINRRANNNQTPRIMMPGGEYNAYVQAHHHLGGAMTVTVDPAHPNSILIV
jgi:hypothetical protein